jgi:hypothetical protein
MSYSHSFTGVTPPARYDGLPWTRILVEEAVTITGPWTQIDSQLIAVDTTPNVPDAINVTTDTAPAETGYFRFRFTDADGSVSPSSDPILSPSVGPGLMPTATDADIRPSDDDIARLCGAYTRERVGGYPAENGADTGRELGSFTTDTTPTLAQVEGFIDMAVREVRGRVGATIAPREAPLARVAATWHTVAQVEAKRLPAGADDTSGSYANAISNYRFSLDELVGQVRRGPVRLA